MQTKTIWQQGGSAANNAENFAAIGQWWSSLNGQTVTWRQRIIPETGKVQDLNWDPQRFDEEFAIASPTLRGITLYWHKPGTTEERNTTPHQLELDHLQQALYIYPQSQPNLVIRIALPQIVYQTVKITQPQLAIEKTGDRAVLIVRDETQRLEIQVNLSPEQLTNLRQLS